MLLIHCCRYDVIVIVAVYVIVVVDDVDTLFSLLVLMLFSLLRRCWCYCHCCRRCWCYCHFCRRCCCCRCWCCCVIFFSLTPRRLWASGCITWRRIGKTSSSISIDWMRCKRTIECEANISEMPSQLNLGQQGGINEKTQQSVWPDWAIFEWFGGQNWQNSLIVW